MSSNDDDDDENVVDKMDSDEKDVSKELGQLWEKIKIATKPFDVAEQIKDFFTLINDKKNTGGDSVRKDIREKISQLYFNDIASELSRESVARTAVAKITKNLEEKSDFLLKKERNELEELRILFEDSQKYAVEAKNFTRLYKEESVRAATSSTFTSLETRKNQASLLSRDIEFKKRRYSEKGFTFEAIDAVQTADLAIAKMLESYKKRLSPDDAKKAAEESKRFDLERLQERKRQIEEINGALKTSFEELALSVKQAEKVDSDADKFTKRLADFSKEAGEFQKKVNKYKTSVETATALLSNVGDVDALQRKIETVLGKINEVDTDRERLFNSLPSLSRDIATLKSDLDKASQTLQEIERLTGTGQGAESKLSKDLRRATTAYNTAQENYNLTTQSITKLETEANNLSALIDQRFQTTEAIEAAIATALGTLQVRQASIQAAAAASAKIAQDATLISQQVTRNDVIVSKIDAELARKIIASRGDVEGLNELNRKITTVGRFLQSVQNRFPSDDFSISLQKLVEDEIKRQFPAVVTDWLRNNADTANQILEEGGRRRNPPFSRPTPIAVTPARTVQNNPATSVTGTTPPAPGSVEPVSSDPRTTSTQSQPGQVRAPQTGVKSSRNRDEVDNGAQGRNPKSQKSNVESTPGLNNNNMGVTPDSSKDEAATDAFAECMAILELV